MGRDKAFEKAEQKIKVALRDGVAKLNLSTNHLTTLPDSIGKLTKLQTLNLDNNQLTTLPDSLRQLTKLQTLNLSTNQLTTLPDSLRQLTQLQTLYLGSNHLTTLSDSIGKLTKLSTLHLENNHLTILPDSIGKLTKLQRLVLGNNQLATLPESLRQLTQLHGLFLGNNHLATLPDSIGQLTKLQTLTLRDNPLATLPDLIGQLTKLQSLYLSTNQLTTLPDSIGQLTQLHRLDLSTNHLTTLPDSIGQLAQLHRLNLDNNQLTTLPDSIGQLTQLQKLDLDNNQLTTLPDSIGQLTQLQRLNLENNQLATLPESLHRCERLDQLLLLGNLALGIPLEILKTGYSKTDFGVGKQTIGDPRAILDWYLQSRAEPAQRLNEAKMLLVGQGGVGKTSLVHYLIYNKPCNPDELPTEGINIDDWDVQGKEGVGGAPERINVHIWDFGGQEIMHATHQFFLTRRSLYLLVIDARAGEKESNIHYWLKIIQSYGGDSPVLVVVNKCDQHPYELNETRLRRDYSNIKGFIQTSCSTGLGIAELRREIGKHARRLPHVLDELPQSYFEVKEELERTAEEKNYIPIADYRAICHRHMVDKLESQDRLIRFLHDLGVVLNFQDADDPFGQNDPFVLNPEWVTGGVYAIINDKELKEKRDGLLNPQKLADVLNALDGYPNDRHDFIVRKMIQFELAYQIDHDKQTSWLIPELLDPKEPSDLDWKPDESLNFQYEYTVLPAGVLCRFIVRMHLHVDRRRSWRSGTVLKIDGNMVLVRGDTENNRVFIAVQGDVDSRREHLAVVREAFHYVHSTISALKPREEIPLPDKPEVSVPYPHLLKLEKAGERTYFPVGADKSYRIVDLLNGVDSALYRLRRAAERIRRRKEMGEKHVFVSYCHANKNDVARLVEDLENAGEQVWWDELILGGRDWKETIHEAMENAYAVVVCLSPELEKRYRSGVYPEIRDAIEMFRQYGPGHSYIFPVRLAECEVPAIEIDDVRTLKRIQTIDLFPESSRAEGIQKLVASLAAAPEHP